jgi:transcriptional regulator with XRE-family HTH domain
MITDVTVLTMTLSIEIMGERVRKLRDKANLSQGGLAALVAKEVNEAEYHQTAISSIERGTRYPSVQVLAALANVLGTNTDYLLGLTDDDKPASDLEDQVVIGAPDPAGRKLLQETVNLLAKKSVEEQRYILELVRKIIGPSSGTIIGE